MVETTNRLYTNTIYIGSRASNLFYKVICTMARHFKILGHEPPQSELILPLAAHGSPSSLFPLHSFSLPVSLFLSILFAPTILSSLSPHVDKKKNGKVGHTSATTANWSSGHHVWTRTEALRPCPQRTYAGPGGHRR